MACGDVLCGGVALRVECWAFAQEVRGAGELAAGARVVVGGEDGDGQFFAEGFEFAGEFRELFADAGVECGCVEVEALAVGRVQDDDGLCIVVAGCVFIAGRVFIFIAGRGDAGVISGTACIGNLFCGVGEEIADLRADACCGLFAGHGLRTSCSFFAGRGLREGAAFYVVADDVYGAFRDVAGEDACDWTHLRFALRCDDGGIALRCDVCRHLFFLVVIPQPRRGK